MTLPSIFRRPLIILTLALAVPGLTMSLAMVGPVTAQGSKWWQSDHFRKELRLTQEQSRRLEEIFQAALPKLRTLKSALDQAERRLEELIERGNDAAVMEQVNSVETARKELNTERTMMLLRMRRALTTDQWVKFTALHQAAERERARSGGPGR